ncbi:MAG: heme exporter protein CcmB [Bacteroidota bacterium]
MNRLWKLIALEFSHEFRQKNALAGTFIYVLATVFVSYLAFRRIVDVPTWNALFWIIMLFAAVNAVARSFMQESAGVRLHYYFLASPLGVVFSRILYNSILLLSIGIISLGAFLVFLGGNIQDMAGFLLGLLLGSMGLASILTMTSAIASRAGNSPTLMAILSFPVLIPFLMVLIRYWKNTIDGIAWTVNGSYALVMAALTGLVYALTYILFPYLWRD